MFPNLKLILTLLAALTCTGLLAADAAKSVVELHSTMNEGWGSGVLVDVAEYGFKDGVYALTANHVADHDKLEAIVGDKKYPVSTVACDPIWDLALMKIDGLAAADLVTLAPAGEVKPGLDITIYGFPGLVPGKEVQEHDAGKVMVTNFRDLKEACLGSNTCQFGYSGGGVIDEKGLLAGVVTGKAMRLNQIETEPGKVVFVQIRLLRWFLDEHRVAAVEAPKKAAGGKVKLLEFYADFCGPCKLMKPNVEIAAKEIGVELAEFKMEDGATSGDFLNHVVEKIPCVIVLRDGVEVDRHYGVHSSEEIESWCK